MAKQQKAAGNKRNPLRGSVVQAGGVAAAFGAFANVATAIIDRIGWPGFMFLLGYWFVVKNASEAQKAEIIDRYFLGKEIGTVYPIIVMIVIFAVVVLGQHYTYRRRLKVKDNEIDRLSEWKSKHQQDRIPGPLHHSE